MYIDATAWSPDGSQIVISGTESNGRLDLYLVAAGGGTLSKIEAGRYNASFPSWSPDAESIVFNYAAYPGQSDIRGSI